MRPVEVETFISAPREEVFDFLADIANRVCFTDHFLKDVRLTSPRTRGEGAAVRFVVDAPVGEQWAELGIVKLERPRLVVEEGRMGRLGRTKLFGSYELALQGHGLTRVTRAVWTEPGARVDALRETLGGRRWLRRQTRIALERLRMVFEDDRDEPLARATVAGYEPLKAARFGA